MSMKEAKGAFDVEKFRAWKRAKKKQERSRGLDMLSVMVVGGRGSGRGM